MATGPFLLIDGNACFHRSRHALSPRIGQKGRLRQPLRAFVSWTLRQVRLMKPDSCAILFDPSDLSCPWQKLQLLFKACGLSSYQHPDLSVGQVAKHLIHQAKIQEVPVTVLSTRKSFLQLVADGVTLIHPARDRLHFRPQRVHELFGVSPGKIPDYLALIGDQGEWIPGVSGIGPKTALQLLDRFGSLEEILQEAQNLPPALKNRLSASSERIRTGKARATIHLSDKFSVPPPASFQCQVPNAALAKELFTREGMIDLLQEILPHHHSVPVRYETVLNASQLADCVRQLEAAVCFAVDTETTGLDLLRSQLVGISLSCGPHSAFYLPVGHDYEEVASQLPLSLLRETLGPLFLDPQKPKIGQNLKFDLQVLAQAGLPLQGTLFDTLVASALLHPDYPSHSLDTLSMIFLGYKMIPFHELVPEGTTMAQVPIEKAAEYACEDADITFQIYQRLSRELLQQPRILQLFQEVEMPFLLASNRIEEGLLVDQEAAQRLLARANDMMQDLAEEIFSLAGKRFNLESPKEIREIIGSSIKHLGRQTRTKRISLSRSSLQAAAQTHPIIPKLIEFRDWMRLARERLPKLSSRINPKTSRVRIGIHPAATGSGALRFGQLFYRPGTSLWDDRLRALIRAPVGFYLVEVCFTQLECRILTHRTRDAILARWCAQGCPHPPPDLRSAYQRVILDAKKRAGVPTLSNRFRPLPGLHSPNPNVRQAAEREALETVLKGSAADLLKRAMLQVERVLEASAPSSRIVFLEPEGFLLEVAETNAKKAIPLVRHAMEAAAHLLVPLATEVRMGCCWSELTLPGSIL